MYYHMILYDYVELNVVGHEMAQGPLYVFHFMLTATRLVLAARLRLDSGSLLLRAFGTLPSWVTCSGCLPC